MLIGDKPLDPAYQPLLAIIERVAAAAGVTTYEVRSNDRRLHAVRARHVAIYLAKRTTPLSVSAISRAIGRDRSTILYAVRQTQRRMFEEGDFCHWILALEATIAEEPPE